MLRSRAAARARDNDRNSSPPEASSGNPYRRVHRSATGERKARNHWRDTLWRSLCLAISLGCIWLLKLVLASLNSRRRSPVLNATGHIQDKLPPRMRTVTLQPGGPYPIDSTKAQRRLTELRARRPTAPKGLHGDAIGISTLKRAQHAGVSHRAGTAAEELSAIAARTAVVILSTGDATELDRRLSELLHDGKGVHTVYASVLVNVCSQAAFAAPAQGSSSSDSSRKLMADISGSRQYAAAVRAAGAHKARLPQGSISVLTDCSDGAFSGIADSLGAASGGSGPSDTPEFTWLIGPEAVGCTSAALHTMAELSFTAAAAAHSAVVIGTVGFQRLPGNSWRLAQSHDDNDRTVTDTTELVPVDALAGSWFTATKSLAAARDVIAGAGLTDRSSLYALSSVLRYHANVHSYAVVGSAEAQSVTELYDSVSAIKQLQQLSQSSDFASCMSALHGQERVLIALHTQADVGTAAPVIAAFQQARAYMPLLVLPEISRGAMWGSSETPPWSALCGALYIDIGETATDSASELEHSLLSKSVTGEDNAAAAVSHGLARDAALRNAWLHVINAHTPVAVLSVQSGTNAASNQITQSAAEHWRCAEASGARGLAHISLPAEEFRSTDWLAALSPAALANWSLPHFSVSIVTSGNIKSLLRLFESLHAVRTYGLPLPMHVYMESTADDATLQLAADFEDSWRPRGSVQRHVRIAKVGALRSTLESHYPSDAQHYGILLQGTAEVSPHLLAWVMYTVLSHQYGATEAFIPNLYGLSLQSRAADGTGGPFDESTAAHEQLRTRLKQHSHISDVHQLPGTGGMVHFPEAWAEFRVYAAARLQEEDSINAVIEQSPTNSWRPSWQRFCAEMAYQAQYFAVFPVLSNQASLSVARLVPAASTVDVSYAGSANGVLLTESSALLLQEADSFLATV